MAVVGGSARKEPIAIRIDADVLNWETPNPLGSEVLPRLNSPRDVRVQFLIHQSLPLGDLDWTECTQFIERELERQDVDAGAKLP